MASDIYSEGGLAPRDASDVASASALTLGTFAEIRSPGGALLARVSLDHALVQPGVGLFLWGWVLHYSGELAAIALTSKSLGRQELGRTDLVPLRRPDVARAFGSNSPDDRSDYCGFGAFIASAGVRPDEPLFIEFTTSEGAHRPLLLDRIPTGKTAVEDFVHNAASFLFETLNVDVLGKLGSAWFAPIRDLAESRPSTTASCLEVDSCTCVAGSHILITGRRLSMKRNRRLPRSLVLATAAGALVRLRWRFQGDRFVATASGPFAPSASALLLPIVEDGLLRPIPVIVGAAPPFPVAEVRRLVSDSAAAPTSHEARHAEHRPAVAALHIVGMRGKSVVGWARSNTRGPAIVELSVEGRRLAAVTADTYDPEGFGERNGFRIPLPDEFFECSTRVTVALGDAATISEQLCYGPGEFDVVFEDLSGAVLSGWVKERTPRFEPVHATLLIDNVSVASTVCDRPVPGVLGADLCCDCGFAFLVPPTFLDGQPHTAQIRVGDSVIGASEFQSRIRGAIDQLNPSYLAGWIAEISLSGPRSVDLEMLIAGEPVTAKFSRVPRQDVGDALGSAEAVGTGFECNLGAFTRTLASFELALQLRGTNVHVLDTPAVVLGRAEEINVLRSCLQMQGATPGSKSGEARDLLCALLPELIHQSRTRAASHRTLFLPKARTGRLGRVVVIVPVYAGLDETCTCIQSVLKATGKNRIPHELIIVYDSGPDPRLLQRLQAIVADADIPVRILENDKNLGFVKSVNRGLELCSGRDVILLNADTEVSGSWIDRLSMAAYASPHIASVTPFSNNGAICSYPEPCAENALPDTLCLEDLDDICATTNIDALVELPTGVGFCMYMRADAIRDVGTLDESWGKGYGEENDWCIRARDRGWVHMLAPNVFVRHAGSVSFTSNGKNEEIARNTRALSNRYPEYDTEIQSFLRCDPTRQVRNKIVVACERRALLAHGTPALLFVAHARGGGIQTHCAHLAELFRHEGVAVFELIGRKDVWKLRCTESGFHCTYTPGSIDELASDLKSLNIQLIHYHSDLDFDAAVWSLPSLLDLPYVVTVHDYLVACPRVHLVDANHRYCGAPVDVQACDACVLNNGPYEALVPRFQSLGNTVTSWRSHYAKFLGGASEVLVPHDDVQRRLGQYFPGVKLRVVHHPHRSSDTQVALPAIAHGEHISVAVIGAIGPQKGFELFSQCATDAEVRGLMLDFHLFGFSCDDERLRRQRRVRLHGPYESQDLRVRLASSSCKVALFLSLAPETFSYTLSEALECGLHPVVLDVGASAERVRALGVGLILNLASTAAQVNDAILGLRPLPARTLELPQGPRGSMLENYYGTDFAEQSARSR